MLRLERLQICMDVLRFVWMSLYTCLKPIFYSYRYMEIFSSYKFRGFFQKKIPMKPFLQLKHGSYRPALHQLLLASYTFSILLLSKKSKVKLKTSFREYPSNSIPPNEKEIHFNFWQFAPIMHKRINHLQRRNIKPKCKFQLIL